MSEKELNLRDLLTDEFLQTFTPYKTFEEFIKQPIFLGRSNTGDIPVEELDAFTKSISEFDSFEDLVHQAKFDLAMSNFEY